MKRRMLTTLVVLMTSCVTMLASDNYRAHRYNEFKGLAVNEQSIVFVGNSITDMQNWPEAFGNDSRIVSRGVSGGFSFEMLANVYNWVYGHPAKVFIKIGTNDLNGFGTPKTIAANFDRTLEIIHAESPATEIYIQSILPCRNGNRSDADIREANGLLKALCDKYTQATFIDLYSQLGGISSGWPYGCADQLHLTAAAYAVWCNIIAEKVGLPTVYPSGTTTVSLQKNQGMTDVHGGRASSFSVQPTSAEDIIFIGDGLVQSGEWHELLPGSKIKNHGTGWEVASGSIDITSKLIDATLQANGTVKKEMPKAILLYTGSTGYDASAYEALITKIHGYGADIKVYCVGLQPKATNPTTANESIAALCAKYSYAKYIDIYTELNKHVSEADYFTNNHPYYMSYVTIAQQIAAQAPELGLTAISTATAQHNYAMANAVELLYTAQSGTGLGQFSTEKLNALKEAIANPSSDLNAAVEAAISSLNMPTAENTADKQFALSTPGRLGLYAYSDGSSLYSTNTNPGYAKYRWELESRADGTFNIKNVADGTYMNPAAAHNSQVKMSKTAPSAGWTLQASEAFGMYLITSGNTCELNSTDKSGNPIYNWYGTFPNTADKGCQWKVEDVTDIPVETEPQPIEVVTGTAQEGASTIKDGNIYTITNHQQNGTCYPLYVGDDNVLTVGAANALASKSYGDRAKFQAIAKDGGKFAFKNIYNGQYLIWRGNDSGFNGNAGVLAEENETYTSLVLTPATSVTSVTNGMIIMGKRNGGTEGGTFVQNADGTWNKWRDTSVGYTATYSNIYTFGDVTDGNDGEIVVAPQTEAGITFSTDAEQHWYYIYSTATVDYAKGKVWYYNPSNDRMQFGDKAFLSDRIWSFWKNSNGKIAIKNFDGIYVGTAGSGTGSNTQFGKSNTANYIYQIDNIANGQFTISDGGVTLHAQQSGSVLVRWAAEPGNASTWNFESVDVSNAAVALSSTTVEQGKVTTGIGNKDVAILRSTMVVSGLNGAINFQGVTGKINATNLKDVKAVRAYFATNAQELFVDADKEMTWRESNATPYAEGTISADGTYTITGSTKLAAGTHYLWIALDIADNATEGNTVDATITGYTLDGASKAESNGNPAHAATIFLSEGAVLMPMDKGSLYYRIPAICTSADGKRLVTLTDDRKNHNADLPSHCYVVAQYSEDNGRTWSNPVTVAGTASTGGDYGHGDASLITNRYNGDIIGIMTCSTNGNGFFGSTPQKPQTWKTITSHDGGITWETPVDHTKSLYGAGSPNPNWLGGFTGSGAGLQKRDGTLVSPFVNRESADGTTNGATQNYYNFMSKDGGKTWYVSGTSGTTAADEPKVLERNNGDLAISVRAGGYNFHNVTSDDGKTWKNAPQTRFATGISGNACDGEYMVWCSTLDGNEQNIAFQTLPNSGSRENVSIALSTDEGETFGAAKTICPRGSAYSAATVLPDGTVGVYYEENGLFGGYTMRFVRFSLKWASNGKYQFTEDKPFHPIHTNVTMETPAYGVQTITLPFTATVPSGMKVYEVTEEVKVVNDGGTERVAAVLEEVTSEMEAFHPYLFAAEAGTVFTFQRQGDWQAVELPENCITRAGALRTSYTTKSLKGDGATIFGNPRNVSSKGGVVFNRISAGNQLTLPAYSAIYENTFEGTSPDAIRIIFDSENAIGTIHENDGTPLLYFDLSGKPAHKNAKGILVGNKHKVMK